MFCLFVYLFTLKSEKIGIVLYLMQVECFCVTFDASVQKVNSVRLHCVRTDSGESVMCNLIGRAQGCFLAVSLSIGISHEGRFSACRLHCSRMST